VLSGDGISIAYADVGKGYPMVFSGSWMTHLEHDWQNPMTRHFLTCMSHDFKIIRYDQRGIGMSDWENVEFTIDRVVDDLESVIDRYDYERVAIFGASQGASVAIKYAVRHPERVSHLILNGGFSRGRRRRNDPAAFAQSEALATLIRQGWAATNPAFRQIMTTMFMPDASPEEVKWFNNFQKTSSTADNMGQVREMYDGMDVSDLLEQVRIPTLVLHCSGDSIAPISEGKYIASRIRGSEFVLLNSNNHMILENESDFPTFLRCVREFVHIPDAN
jgi:pimeloyl-ACP methyl ester carboxylesterase